MAFNPTSAKKVKPSAFNPTSAKPVAVEPDDQGTPWLGKDGLISRTFQAGTTSLAQSGSELAGQAKAITRYPDQQYMEPEQVEADDSYRASSAMSLAGRPTISGINPVDLSPEQRAEQTEDIASDDDIATDRMIAEMLAEKANEVRAPEAKEGPWTSFKGFVANAGESGVRMAPALALGSLTGGSSVVALSAIGADVMGASLYEGREMGLSEEDNMTRAGLNVMAEVVPESLVIGKFLKAVPGQQLRNWVKATVGEGAQEMVTEMMQNVIDKGIYDEDASAKEVFNWLASKDGWKQITYAGAIGMGMGAALAAPAAVVPTKDSASGEMPTDVDADPVSLGIEDGQTIDQEVTDVDSIRPSESTRGQEISAQAIQQQPQDGSRGSYAQPLELVPLAEQSVRQPDAEGERWLQGVDSSVQPAEQEPGGLQPTEVGSAIEYAPPEIGEADLELVPQEDRMGLPSGAFPDRVLARYRGEIPYESASIGPTKTETLARNVEAEIAEFADQTAEDFRQPLVEDPPDYAPSEPVKYTQSPGLEDSRIQEDMYRETIKGMADRLPADLGSKDKINVQRDDLFTAVAKLGGISRAEAKKEGIDPAQFTQRAGGRYVFPAEGGRPLDELQEALPESGFDVSDRNGLLDLIDQQFRGDTVYSMNNAFDQADNAWYERLSANSETKLPPQAVKRAVEKALAGEKLGAREARILGAMLDEASEGTQEAAIESGQVDVDVLIDEYFSAPEEVQELAFDLLDAMVEGVSVEAITDDGSVNEAYEQLEQIRQAEPAGDAGAAGEALSDTDAQSGSDAGAAAAIEAAANEAATSPLNDRPEPTPAQKEAGNYKKGAPFTLHGLRIVIENPKGSIRKGDGWQNTMAAHYGDVKRTEGADGDAVDVFVGDNPESEQAWIIDQVDQKTGAFDEHKVMLGFKSEESAIQAYQDSYDGGWTVGPVSALPVQQLKLWMERGDTTEPFAPGSAFPVKPASTEVEKIDVPAPVAESPINSAPSAELTEVEQVEPTPEPVTDIADAPLDEEYEEQTADTLRGLIEARMDVLKTNRDLKRTIADFNDVKVGAITAEQMKEGQEIYEALLVERARDTVTQPGADDKMIFKLLLQQYKNQLNLNVRSSTSMENQAYSTPAPIAYLAARMAGIDQNSSVYEPTAGNGMLLLTASKDNALVNELNGERADALQAQGFDVTRKDATTYVPDQKVDAVIANPPFGKMRTEDGKVKSVPFEGYKLREIDHLISANSMQAMKDDGRTVLIIGADDMKPGNIRANDRIFFNWLYGNHNVVDHFEIDGDLYRRQGAGWSIAVIVVDGRAETGKFSPKNDTIERLSDWDAIYERSVSSMVDTAGRPERVRTDLPRREAKQPVVEPASDDLFATQQDSEADSSVTKPASRSRAARDAANDERAGRPGDGDNSQRLPDTPVDEPGLQEADAATDAGSLAAVGRTDARSVSATPRKRPVKRKASGSGFQAVYEAKSSGFNDEVLTPRNMAEPTNIALDELEAAVGGDIDAYVVEKLGYKDKSELYDAFMGLQVDAVAAAIYNFEAKGKGIIIADQTGVGKGRQAAGILRYAMRAGKTPVFLTVKDNLFTDMYNDLADIGVKDAKPFILNNDVGIKQGNKTLFANKGAPRKRMIAEAIESRELPKDTNMLFFTYSQVNTENDQRRLVSALSDNAVIVMDESHNAAGEREKIVKGGKKITGAGFIYDLIDKKDVAYLSATYAKRPDNMPIYYRTDVMDAVDSSEQLITAVSQGGVPLQQVMSSMLAESGQLFRRERSFDGISIPTVIDYDGGSKHSAMADQVTTGLRAITDVDRSFHAYVKESLKDEYRDVGGDVVGAGNRASSGVDHTNFNAVVHNYVRQLLLALKADKAVEIAIEQHKKGVKPVIALENTMGSFLAEYAQDAGLEQGDMVTADYRDILSRALDRTRRISIKDAKGDSSTKDISLSELPPSLQKRYAEARKIIDSIEIENLPLSPIDYMRQKLSDAGIKVAEITGRDLTIEYGSGDPILGRRDPKEKKDKRGTVDKFTNGELDALILNVAGSTGLSIHASEKFKDQKPRHMIVAQPMLDVNILVQMLGRINRTGQVELPGYTVMGLDLPAEKRPLAVAARKMKSLNANTSANSESDTSLNAPDMLNKYGDRVVSEYLRENTLLARELDVPVPAANAEGDVSVDGGVALKVTGRMALLPVERQEEIYSDLETSYSELIDFLTKTGQNDLEAATVDLQAKILDSKIAYEGKAPDTIFGQHTTLHRVDAKYQGNPPTPDDVVKAVEKGRKDGPNADEILARKAKHEASYLASLNKRVARANERLEEAQKALASAKDENAQSKAAERVDKAQESLADSEAAVSNVATMRAMVARQLSDFQVGQRVYLNLGDEHVNGVVIGLKDTSKDGSGNPYAFSKTRIKFMVASGIRQIEVNLNQLDPLTGIVLQHYNSNGEAALRSAFKVPPGDRREVRYIATGNLIAGSAELKGRIVNFTDIGGKTYQGILMPKTFDREKYDGLGANNDVNLRDIEATAKMLSTSDIRVFGPNKAVTIERVRDEFEIAVPKSNRDSVAKLVKFDDPLRAMIGDFYGSNKFMTQRFDESQLPAVLTRLLELTPLYAPPEARPMYEASGGTKEVEAVSNFDGEDRPQFSMGTRISAVDRDGENGRQTIAQVKDAIGPVVAKWKSGPKVEVVADPRTVLKDRITESEAASIAGMYWRGKVYLFSSNIASPEQALRTLAHEAVGHYGIERMLGSDFEALMIRVDKLKTSSQAVGAAWREVQQRYRGSSRRLTASQEAAEIVAVMAERGDKHPLIQRAIAAVKRWLRSVGFNMPWTDGDIRALIDRAEANLHSSHFATMGDAGEVRYSRVADEGPTRFDVLPENWKDALMRVIVDKYHPIKRAQKAIRESGADIPEYADAFLAQELINGRIDDRVRKFEEGRVQTLVDAMAEAGVSVEALDVYLYAKHATERNEHIAEINEFMPDGGSGMSNAEARAILSHAREVGEAAKLEELAQMVYQINRDRLDVLQRYGLESEETIDSWGNYAFYVPLKGGPNAPKRAGTGKGFDIRGRESMQALGRRSLADSPLMNSIAQFEESIIRSEKSRVGQTLLNLARENPNAEYWEVFEPGEFEVIRRFNPNTREVEYVENHLMFNDPSMVSVKVEGQPWFIKLHDERLLAAVKNLGPDSLNRFMQVMSGINRVLASLNTSFNPEFVISNAARDIQTAIYNVIAEQDLADGKIAGKQLAKQIVKDIPKALRGTYGALKGKEQTEWQRHFNEFRAAGGKIGFFGLKDLEARTVEINGMLSMARGGTAGNLRRVKKKIADSIEDLNASVENAARLSAYVNARRSGVSKPQAASLAKNLTVNFNRRGELGTVANAFWMFANASIQGTAIFARVLKSRKAQQIAGAMVAATFVLAELNRLLGGEDDDGKPYWEDVPDYVRERNLVIMDPLSDSGQFYSIPLPYGYNVFNVLGNVTNDLVHGGSPLKAAAEMSGAIMGSFNPIGFQSSDDASKAVAKSVSPTALTPIVQIGVNENFYGGPIFSPYKSIKPDSERGWNSTPDAFKSVSRFLNTVTGGNPQQPGLVDVSPQSIKHLAEFVTGGAGATVNRTYSVIEKIAQNGEIEVREVPFVRKVRGSVNSYSDNDQFRQRADELKQVGKRYQALKGQARFEFKKEHRWQLNTIDKARELESYLRRSNKEVRLAEERGDTDKVKRLRERSDKHIDRFNKLYNEREKAGN